MSTPWKKPGRLAPSRISPRGPGLTRTAGAPFGYASVFAPAMLFYELTEGRSIDAAVQRLRAHDDELATWQLVRPADELA